jgi:imidazolonepropionase-like amidohydrolase
MKKANYFLFIIFLFATMVSGFSNDNNSNLTLAIIHVSLIPMTAEVVLTDQTVLIEGDRIMAIGNSGEVKIPRGAKIIDGDGAYLMPGLADMHVHIYEESRDEYPVSPLNLYVAKGVTTIRDCGTAPLSPSDRFVLDWRDEILRGELVGPMIYSSGRTINGPVSNPGRVVQQRHTDGFDFAKLYMELSMDEFTDAQNTAEELGMYTVGHIPYQVGFENAISAGLDEIAHLEELTFELLWSGERPTYTLSMDQWLSSIVSGAFDIYGYEMGSDIVFDPNEFDQIQGQFLDRILNGLISNDIPVGTTLATYDVVDQKLFDQDAFLAREANVYLPEELIEEVINGQNRHQLVFQALGDNQAAWFLKRELDIYILQKLREAGVLLVSGTDAGSSSIGVVEGFSTHDDLHLLTEFEFTPYEDLLTATVNAAYVVGKMTGENDFGTIEIGKRADLILVGGNPLEDIKNTRDILGVMVRGKWYQFEDLEAMIALED